MRSNDICKYQRGQVWWIREPAEVSAEKIASRSHIQAKSRPYLIVSINASNFASYILNVVPISNSSNKNFISHVVYTNDRGVSSVIECEQITTVSSDIFRDRGNYLYTLSDDIMEQVSFKLAHQLGAEYQLPDMQVIINVIEKLAKEKAAAVKKTYQNSLDSAVLDLGVKLEQLFDLKSDEEEPNVVIPASVVEKVEEVKKDLLDVDSGVDVIKQSIPRKNKHYQKKNTNKRHYIRWTEEKKSAFLEDAKTMDINALAKKWDISKGSIPKYICQFKKEQLNT